MAKLSTSKKHLAVFASLTLFFVGCVSKKDVYKKPDFTDSEILKNEIRRIEKGREKKPAYSLWQAALLAQADGIANDNKAALKSLYADSAKHLVNLFYEAAKENKYSAALKYAKSLEVLQGFGNLPPDIGFDNQFAKTAEQMQKVYAALPRLQNTKPADLSSFIQGALTVWMDLGIKVEKGMGYTARVIGSGFFIDERGYIITNHHVIESHVDPEYEGYSRLYVKLFSDSETRIPAKIVGWDKALDLALLKTEINPPYVYALGSSQNLKIGNRIYAIGSPVGLESTITSGIISSFNRKLLSTAAVMQIDAAVNAGNSGGPLVSEDGAVQGIVFAGLPAYQGLNFAIPVEYLKLIINRLYEGGELNHSWMGCYGRTYKNLPSDAKGQGIEILYVMPGSPADYAGLKKGEIITHLDGHPVADLEELQFALISLMPDIIVPITYRYDETAANEKKIESSKTITLCFETRPQNPGYEVYKREPAYKMTYPVFGMELVPVSERNKNKFSVKSLIKGGVADEAGFSVLDPVEIVRTRLSEKKEAVFAEIYTKKRKSGYMEANLAIGAPLDSPFFF